MSMGVYGDKVDPELVAELRRLYEVARDPHPIWDRGDYRAYREMQALFTKHADEIITALEGGRRNNITD
jgi:hypothetical protein